MNRLWTPLILINMKAYLEGTDKKALELALKAEEVTRKTDVCVGVAPQNVDLRHIAQAVSIPVFAQHVDAIKPGGYTGHVLPEAVKKAGATGTIINHSERRLTLAEIDITIKMAKRLDLAQVVCTNNTNVTVSAATLHPDFVAFEPPELIGTGKSVSKTKPEVIVETVKLVKEVNPKAVVLCGAGITTGDDVAAALKLGTEGVLVASGIVKAKHPAKTLLEFAEAIITT